MKDQIQDIITRFGPRLAGSQAEKSAQEYIADQLRRITDAVSIEPFESPLTAKWLKLKWYVLGYILSLALFFLSPWSALVLASINATVLICDLMRNDGIVDFFYPMLTSWNVTATIEPQGEVKSTLLISGHMDSTKENIWWFRLGRYGGHITVVIGFLIGLLPIVFILFLFSAVFLPSAIDFCHYLYFTFVLLSPLTIIYYTFQEEIVVEGACDNLSGVIIAKEVVEHFASMQYQGKSVLQHTRLRFISFGAEEAGLRGSTAYVKQHLAALKAEKAHLLNIDSVRLPNQVNILTGEMMSFVTFDKNLVAKTKSAFDSKNIPYKTGSIPMGATDAIPFQQQGIPALTIIGINMESLDPTYHTRLDITENVDEQALKNVRNGLIEMIVNWDK